MTAQGKKMAPKKIDETVEENLEVENLDETAAAESLHPQSHTENDPKSKVETLKAMVDKASSMTNTELTKWFTSMIAQYPGVAKAHGDAGANRATNNMKAGGSPVAPMPPIKIKEDLDTLFEGESLTEEAKDKITTLFEAAVSVRAALVEAELQEAYEAALEEEVSKFINETQENLSAFLDYSVDKWIEENEVAIVDSLRLENAESFMENLKGLMTESYFTVPENRLDVVSEMAEHVEEVEGQLSDALTENQELRKILDEATRKSITDDLKEGLTMVDAEKLDTLIESVEFTSPEEYEKKVSVIKEKYFPTGAKKTNDGVETLNEENLGAIEKVIYTDPVVEATVNMLNKMGR